VDKKILARRMKDKIMNQYYYYLMSYETINYILTPPYKA